jgi:hypothetical protein
MKTNPRNRTLSDKLAPQFAIALIALAGLSILTSCGTTSSLQGAHGGALTSTRKFSKVTVQDFKSSLADVKVAPAKKYFADQIAAQLRRRARFSSVTRNAKPDANTVVIDGVITKYEEGSKSLRFWIGMGAGSSFFEADVQFRDNKGVAIGKIKVDKNSWPLGGSLASEQTPERFMDGAAEKVAEEAGKLAK